MISDMWRLIVAAFDIETNLRKLRNEPLVDVVFISNMRDQVDRKRFLGNKHPICGHFDGTRMNIKGIQARVRIIDSTAEETLSAKGRRKARQQFIDATQWAVDKGAKVILLAASTKRFFGRDGKELKALFPNVLFTIGDNGTSLILIEEVFNLIKRLGPDNKCNKILILGPYGILGEAVTKALVNAKYNVIGMGANQAGLELISDKYGITTYQSFTPISDVDMVVACTHSQYSKLSSKIINRIRCKNKKLVVVDVAEPSNLDKEEYKKCSEIVIRQDAGNAYSENLNYVLGYLSYSMMRMSKGVVFGCFAEAMSLFNAIKFNANDGNIYGNYFYVNDENMNFIKEQFARLNFIAPSPINFGKPWYKNKSI